MKAMLNQGLDYGAAGNLDGDGDASGIRGQFSQPLCESRNRAAGVCKRTLGHSPPFVVQQARLVGFTRPVDANVDLIIALHHSSSFSLSARR
jgi:hypothetical protein